MSCVIMSLVFDDLDLEGHSMSKQMRWIGCEVMSLLERLPGGGGAV